MRFAGGQHLDPLQRVGDRDDEPPKLGAALEPVGLPNHVQPAGVVEPEIFGQLAGLLGVAPGSPGNAIAGRSANTASPHTPSVIPPSTTAIRTCLAESRSGPSPQSTVTAPARPLSGQSVLTHFGTIPARHGAAARCASCHASGAQMTYRQRGRGARHRRPALEDDRRGDMHGCPLRAPSVAVTCSPRPLTGARYEDDG